MFRELPGQMHATYDPSHNQKPQNEYDCEKLSMAMDEDELIHELLIRLKVAASSI
jgi:hypothetical protein